VTPEEIRAYLCENRDRLVEEGFEDAPREVRAYLLSDQEEMTRILSFLSLNQEEDEDEDEAAGCQLEGGGPELVAGCWRLIEKLEAQYFCLADACQESADVKALVAYTYRKGWEDATGKGQDTSTGEPCG
jgi:hypothetical protein